MPSKAPAVPVLSVGGCAIQGQVRYSCASGVPSSTPGSQDHEDKPLPGATVTIDGGTPYTRRTTVSDENGMYRFDALPCGESYFLRCEKAPYRSSDLLVQLKTHQCVSAPFLLFPEDSPTLYDLIADPQEAPQECTHTKQE